MPAFAGNLESPISHHVHGTVADKSDRNGAHGFSSKRARFTSAIRPKAAVRMVEFGRAANDPKQTSNTYHKIQGE